MIKKSQHKGFTLVEFLLYFALFSILLVGVMSLFLATLEQQTRDEGRGSIQQDMQAAVSFLTKDLRSASDVSVPASAGQTADSLSLTIDGSAVEYEVVGGRLQRTDSLGSAFLNNSETNVSSIQFERLENVGGKPTISFDLEFAAIASVAGVPIIEDVSSVVSLR